MVALTTLSMSEKEPLVSVRLHLKRIEAGPHEEPRIHGLFHSFLKSD
jgi:hypothetical protein